MATLFVGSMSITNGIIYQGIIPKGNAFRITENIRLSINKGPFAALPLGIDILNHPDFTYVFENDTTVLLTRVVTPDLTIVYENACPNEVPLVASVESASICSVINTEEISSNGGDFAAAAYVESASNQVRNITIRLYSNNVLLQSAVIALAANESKNVVIDYATIAVITAGLTNHFTLEADGDNCIVRGLSTPSRIRLEKTTL